MWFLIIATMCLQNNTYEILQKYRMPSESICQQAADHQMVIVSWRVDGYKRNDVELFCRHIKEEKK